MQSLQCVTLYLVGKDQCEGNIMPEIEISKNQFPSQEKTFLVQEKNFGTGGTGSNLTLVYQAEPAKWYSLSSHSVKQASELWFYFCLFCSYVFPTELI